MIYVLYTLFFVSCIVLIGAVLLQPGKTDAGALFTSNISSSAYGPRGTATVLSKITIGAAIVFMLSALLITMPAMSGGSSVLNSVAEPAAEAPADTPAANTAEPAANANAAAPSSSESNSAPPAAPSNN